MIESNYEENPNNSDHGQKKHDGLGGKKFQLVAGICLLLYTLFILPFHADNVSEISGDEVKAGNQYGRQQVYYIENLRLLRAETDDDQIYCIARFLDRDQNDWIILFTPGKNKQLTEKIRSSIDFDNKLNLTTSVVFGNILNLTTSGYFQLEDLDYISTAADAFYRVYGRTYADAKAQNILSMYAEYLCEKNDNYTLQALLRPGIPLASLVFGLYGIISGGLPLIRNRFRNASSDS